MKLTNNQFFSRKYFFNIKLLIYIFLLWNIFKLFHINADPIIQVLNALLSIGIYFDIEDKDLIFEKRNKPNKNLFLGLLLLIIIIIRSFNLLDVSDKFYYFLLPCGIIAISLIGQSSFGLNLFRNIIFISFLLPLRRIFFFLINPVLLFFTKYLTLFILLCLGTESNLINRSIFIGGSELVISDGCGGTDNLFFAISSLIIYRIIFSLKNTTNKLFIYLITFIVPILINVIRNTLLALVINLETNYRDNIFTFFHDSYGSLIFNFISLLIISCFYFKLLNQELDLNKD